MPEEDIPVPGEAGFASGPRQPQPPGSTISLGGAPWTTPGGDDSILEIEFFDDEEAAQAGAAKAETLRTEGSQSYRSGRAETPETIEQEPSQPEQATAAILDSDAPLDLPELDDDLGALEPPDSHEAAEETARDMMDFAPPEEEGSSNEPLFNDERSAPEAPEIESAAEAEPESEAE
jgi:hypothetical protein